MPGAIFGSSYLNAGMNLTSTPGSRPANGKAAWERLKILANSAGAACGSWAARPD